MANQDVAAANGKSAAPTPATKPIINPFKKAVKYNAKARLALIGPAGSGKSITTLIALRALVGPEGRIAAIDTEHGTLSKYAHTHTCGGPSACVLPDHFDFDVIDLESFSPDAFLKNLDAAGQNGYDAFMCDSLSHFWIGKDGALEFVDMANKRNRDQMAGWKELRPHERAMIDAMTASKMHIGVTMRTKTEYGEEVDQKTGKKKRVKIGLAPVQREGLEYEFDIVGYMDERNNLIVDKSRCFAFTGKVFEKPASKDWEVYRDWLKGDAAPEKISREQAEDIYALARAKAIGSQKLLAELGVTGLGALTVDRIADVKNWISKQPAPPPPPPPAPAPAAPVPAKNADDVVGQVYDKEFAIYVRMGFAISDLNEFVEILPWKGQLGTIAGYMKDLRESMPYADLLAIIQRRAPAPGVPEQNKTAKAPDMESYDEEIEFYVRSGISMADLEKYVLSLPFSDDLVSVAGHLKNLRERKTGGALSAAIRRESVAVGS